MKHIFKNTPLILWLFIPGAWCLLLFYTGLLCQEQGNRVTLYLIGVISFSVIVSIIVTYFLYMPRLKEIVQVLQAAGNGDFSVRVTELGSGDELGLCTKQVNLLISTIQEYIGRLHELNRVGEELANALTRDEVVRVVVETVESQFDGRCAGVFEWSAFVRKTDQAKQYVAFLSQAKIDRLVEGGIVTVSEDEPLTGSVSSLPVKFLYVPVVEQNVTTSVMVFGGRNGDLLFSPVVGEFVGTLSRLVSNAFSRIMSIHEMTRAESKYRALFMMMQGGMFRANGSGQFEDINPALAAMGGYDSVEDMLQNIANISEVYANPEERKKIVEQLYRDGWIKGLNLELRRKDGSSFPALVTAHLVFNEAGDVVAVEGNVADMTERTRREQAEREHAVAEAASRAKSEMLDDLEGKNQQLRATLDEMRVMQRQLLQSEKMATIGTMAAGVAHELNNILAASVSYPELMMMQLPEDSELRKPLTAIRNSGTRAVDIINDLLLLSKGTSKGMKLQELNDLLQSCFQSLDVVKVLALNSDLQLETRLCSESVYLRCTALHVQKAIVNMLTSALETAGTKGAVTITADLVEIEHDTLYSLALREGLYCVVMISFDDSSVNREYSERIFDPFYFSSVSGKKSVKSGLGLTVAWNLIQEHEGAVVAESGDDGSGGSFRIYLPVTREPETGESLSEQHAEDLKGNGTILVVDDEPLQRDITERMLTELGYQAYLVASGERAIEFVEKRPVDLVLLDMLMPPGMSGYETYREILSIRPGQKALIISGFSSSEDIEKTLALGAGGLLKKPYSLVQLGHMIMTELK